jgi:hypothetical protein
MFIFFLLFVNTLTAKKNHAGNRFNILLFLLIKINFLCLVMSLLDDYPSNNEDPDLREKERELLDGDDGDGDEEPMDVGDGGGARGDQAQQQQESAAKSAPPPPAPATATAATSPSSPCRHHFYW